jgi:hypothetical protein
LYNIFEEKSSLVKHYDAVFLLDVIEHINNDADRVQGHLRRYAEDQLARLFDRCGVEAQNLQLWGLLMVPFLFVRKMLLDHKESQGAERILGRGFVPPNGIARALFQGLKNIETAVPFPIPFGTSILAWGNLPTLSND